jgi:hypothetical protein
MPIIDTLPTKLMMTQIGGIALPSFVILIIAQWTIGATLGDAYAAGIPLFAHLQSSVVADRAVLS